MVSEQLILTVTLDAERRAVLQVRGEVDITTADAFRDAALDAVRRHEHVVFDLEGAMLIDPSGLRVLSAVLREAHRLGRPAPVLRGARPLLAKSLTLTGLGDKFAREPAQPVTPARRTPIGYGTVPTGVAGMPAAA